MSTIRKELACVACLAITSLAACTKDDAPLGPTISPARHSVAVTTRSGQYSYRDSLWFSYVDAVPGFGGMYFDDSGDLVVFLTDTTRASRARAAEHLASYIGKSYRPSSLPTDHPPTMRFQLARHDYRELFDYKEKLLSAMSQHIPSLAGIAVDERLNRVLVAVTDQTGAAAATGARAELGLSEEALAIAFESRSQTVSDTVPYFNSFALLSASLVGGLYIKMYNSPWDCTLGLPVNWSVGAGNYYPGFLTAQHCFTDSSNNSIYADSVYALDSGTSPYVVGDLEFNADWTHSCTYQGTVHTDCMHADVALVSSANRAYGYNRKLFGIAHGSSSTTSGYGAGQYHLRVSTYDGTSNGPFIVDAEPLGGAEVVGQYVQKVGYWSGWTIGQIDVIGDRPRPTDNRIIRGSVSVAAGVHRGDSGSPVWYTETYVSGNPRAKFDGIVWGAHGSANGSNYYDHFDFSPIYKVRQQLTAYAYNITTY